MTRRNVTARVVLGGLMALTTAATFVPPASDAETAACGFRLGFKELRDQIPDVVGNCLEEERFEESKNRTEQATTGGLLVWDKQENLTSFTDGNRTWLAGPRGVESRLNQGPLLAWESIISPTQPQPSMQDLYTVDPPQGWPGPAAVDQLRNTLPTVAASMLPKPQGANGAEERFILTAAGAARDSQRATGVPASVTIAQAILESSWGKSRLSRDNNNYFGIKARERDLSDPAKVVWYDTWEVIDGEDVVVQAPFRAYNSATESFVDHGYFFIRNPRYAAALAVKSDPKQFAVEISRAGYATDPAYAPKLVKLMDKFNLYAYDLKDERG